jgi:hypothetical protein
MEEKSVQVAETQASDDISKTSPIHLSRDANVTGRYKDAFQCEVHSEIGLSQPPIFELIERSCNLAIQRITAPAGQQVFLGSKNP